MTPDSPASDHGHGHGEAHHGHQHGGAPGSFTACLGARGTRITTTTLVPSTTPCSPTRRAAAPPAVSLAGLLLTGVVQAAVVTFSGSVGLLADTIHNFADALTALPIGLAFWPPATPPTAGTPTGMDKPRIWPDWPSSP